MVEDTILIAQHRREKEDSIRFKERRTNQWNENYFLYRDKVITNRLTQRQPVNIPIMRDTLQSWLSKIDEEPQLDFSARGRDNQNKQGEIYVNEMWNYTYDKQSLDLKDNMDKKIVGLQGRSFKYWYYKNGQVHCDVLDPYDIDIDPRVNPFDIETASYINHKNIFIPLRRILANKSYDADAKNLLKQYLGSKEGLLKAQFTDEEYEQKKARLTTLGVDNYDEYRASDVMVELNRSYKLLWDNDTKKFVRHLIVIALDNVVLYNKPLKKAVGIDYTPISTWASDPDLNDFWSDGDGDAVRTVNKVVNMYFSQDVENRAYRNFGMYFYNTLNGTFQPQAFEAKPFGMYGLPGNPSDILQQVKIEPLEDTGPTIEYLKNLIQSSVAQTPTERGVNVDNDATLGEVQLSLQQSKQRQSVVAKQYRKSWEQSGKIWYDLMEANSTGSTTLYKKGQNGEMHERKVSTNEWKTPKGYEVKVTMKSEKEANDDTEFKKNQFIKQSFATNPVAMRISRRKDLELLGWDPDEIDEVMQAEAQQAQQTQLPVAGEEQAQTGQEVTPATV